MIISHTFQALALQRLLWKVNRRVSAHDTQYNKYLFQGRAYVSTPSRHLSGLISELDFQEPRQGVRKILSTIEAVCESSISSRLTDFLPVIGILPTVWHTVALKSDAGSFLFAKLKVGHLRNLASFPKINESFPHESFQSLLFFADLPMYSPSMTLRGYCFGNPTVALKNSCVAHTCYNPINRSIIMSNEY